MKYLVIFLIFNGAVFAAPKSDALRTRIAVEAIHYYLKAQHDINQRDRKMSVDRDACHDQCREAHGDYKQGEPESVETQRGDCFKRCNKLYPYNGEC